MLITYGIAFIYLERREQVEPAVTELHKLPYRTALYIGLFQVLSLFPGTSRSGATIVGGLINGVSRPVVTEFTFYLGIPAMFGASLLKVGKFALGGHSLVLGQLFILLVAMGVAFVVSMYAIRFLTDYVKNHIHRLWEIPDRSWFHLVIVWPLPCYFLREGLNLIKLFSEVWRLLSRPLFDASFF